MDFIKKYLAGITAIAVFIVYVFTLAPSVIQIDAGELAAVQFTLGVAHPTGYPLFTLLGYLLLKIPLPFSTIYQANLIASVWCALAVFLFIKSSLLLMNIGIAVQETSKSTKRYKVINNVYLNPKEHLPFAAAISGIFIAFNKTYWDQSVAVEVYSLQVFLFMLIIFTTLKAYSSNSVKNTKWIWVALAYALGFSNHMTTLLAIPFTAVLFFQKEKFSKSSFVKIGFMAIVFFPVLILFYSYLPLKASGNPTINWGNANSFENFFRHITGRQYSVWLFSSVEAAKKHLADFVTNFAVEFAFIGLIIGIVGLFELFKMSKKIFIAVLTTFLFGVLYSINYDIVDLASYFLLSNIMFAFFIAAGFVKIISFLMQKFNNKIIVSSILISCCSIPVIVNYSNVNQSGIYSFEDYTKAIMNSSEKNSIIFSYQWDYFISPSYYYQHCENYRTDLSIVDKELLRRSWYYNQLKRNHPDILKNMDGEIKSFLSSVQPFERDQIFDSNVIEKNYRDVMTKLITGNEDRNFYMGLELFQSEISSGQFAIPEGYQIVPHLLMFKVVKGNQYVTAPNPNFTIRLPKVKNSYIQFIETSVATMLTYRASYELQFGFKDRAQTYLKKVINSFSGYQIPTDILTKAGM